MSAGRVSSRRTGGGTLVLESLPRARERGAKIYAEVLGAAGSSDASHHTKPSPEGQARLIAQLLNRCGVALEEVDYVNAHATSTPLGDITEIRALKQVFGAHAKRLKINASKSMLGHTCWSSAIVEIIAVLLQMQAGRLHPTINVHRLDPEIDLDVCANVATVHQTHTVLKNAFGFGGINCINLLRSM